MTPHPPIGEVAARPSAIAGPIDRVSFFDEQRRHRRSTWRATAMAGLAALITGLPLSLILTPVLFALVLGGTRLAGLAIDVPQSVWDTERAGGRIVVTAFYRFDDDPTTHGSIPDVVKGVLIWLLPGLVAMVLMWPLIRALFLRAGAGSVILSAGARPPHLDDPEERQLVNVVEELALAAGRTPPRVMIIDGGAPNAAIVGHRADDAVIVVTRPLLDVLERDETTGVIAHLIASAGNGDLRVALTIISVYQTMGVAGSLLRIPFSGEARRNALRLLWVAILRRGSEKDAAELAGAFGSDEFSVEEDDLGRITAPNPDAPRPNFLIGLLWLVPPSVIALIIASAFVEKKGTLTLAIAGWCGLITITIITNLGFLLYGLGRIVLYAWMIVLLPYYLAVLMPQLLMHLISSFVLHPMMALAWRTRRYLADATAVQLTRDPDGLAQALIRLNDNGGPIPGGDWAAPLFIVGRGYGFAFAASANQIGATEAPDERLAALAGRLHPTASAAERAQVVEQLQRSDAFREAVGEARQTRGRGAMFGGGGVTRYHPPVNRRLRRLRALGATVPEPVKGRGVGPSLIPRRAALWVQAIVAMLLAIVAVLFTVLIAMLVVFSLAVTGLLMLGVLAAFGLLK